MHIKPIRDCLLVVLVACGLCSTASAQRMIPLMDIEPGEFHADYQSEVLPAHPVWSYPPSRFGFEVKKWASEYAYSLTL